MTTNSPTPTLPLDLTALRRDIVSAAKCEPGDAVHPWEEVDPDHLIELIDRVEAAESTLVELKPADVLIEDSWFAVADLPTILGNFMRSSDQFARDAKEAHIRAEVSEAKVAAVRELHKPAAYRVGSRNTGIPEFVCEACHAANWGAVEHPCPTITALDGQDA